MITSGVTVVLTAVVMLSLSPAPPVAMVPASTLAGSTVLICPACGEVVNVAVFDLPVALVVALRWFSSTPGIVAAGVPTTDLLALNRLVSDSIDAPGSIELTVVSVHVVHVPPTSTGWAPVDCSACC